MNASELQPKAKLDVEIKDYIRNYIIKAKSVNVKQYIEQNIDVIKINFDKKNEAKISAEQRESFIPNYINRKGLSISNDIQEIFEVNIEGDSLYEFISNFSKDDSLNLSMLGLVEPGIIGDCKPRRTYNRLNNNFLDRVNKIFTIEELDVMKQFLLCNHSVDSKLTIEQQRLLILLIPLLKESKTEIVVDEESKKFKFVTEIPDISLGEETKILEYKRLVSQYNKMKKEFFITLNKEVPRIVNDDSKETFFKDDYYELNSKYSYLNNYLFVAKVIDYIVKYDFHIVELSESIQSFLEDIVPCYLVSSTEEDIKFLCDFLGNIEKYPKSQTFKITELSNLYKFVTIYNYIDENIINILGEKVCKKLVFKNQFIDKINNDETITNRLEKAVFAMSKAHDMTHSSIPYFDDITVGNITLQRYNNADSEILTSGIDTNTCFKLDGNDNDFILYSILSSNGLVIKILENGELCGRITANLYFNVLIINGIRNKDNTYKISSSDERKRNQNILNAVELLAQKLIDMTTYNKCPIDFVCTNMAGILESYNFWNEKEQISPTVITNPIDTYNDDFKNFLDLFKEHPEYLNQVNVNEQSSYFNSSPFTTDFGSYSFVLIKSRDNKILERKSDVAYEPQPPIYERPNVVSIAGSGYLTEEGLNQCEKIKSLHIFNTRGFKDSVKVYCDLSKKFRSFVVSDTEAILETTTGTQVILKIR